MIAVTAKAGTPEWAAQVRAASIEAGERGALVDPTLTPAEIRTIVRANYLPGYTRGMMRAMLLSLGGIPARTQALVEEELQAVDASRDPPRGAEYERIKAQIEADTQRALREGPKLTRGLTAEEAKQSNEEQLARAMAGPVPPPVNPWALPPERREGPYEGEASVVRIGLGPSKFYPGNRPYDSTVLPDVRKLRRVADAQNGSQTPAGARDDTNARTHGVVILVFLVVLVFLAT